VYDPQQAGLAALYARLDTKETAGKTISPVSSLSRKPATAAAEKKTEVATPRPTPRIVK